MRIRFTSALFTLFISVAFVALGRPALTAQIQSGILIRGSQPAVYYYHSDGKRYVFPNENTYRTWYANFDQVVTVADSELASFPIGGSVTYRPGVKMIKIQTDPKVYAVARGGVLRWITSEEIARILYGTEWAKQVEDLSDAFFTNYRSGAAVENVADFVSYVETDASASIASDLTLRGSTQSSPPPQPTQPIAPTQPVFDWKVRIDQLYFANYQRSIDSGRLILTDGRFKVVLPDVNAEDYGKIRLHQLRVCAEFEEPTLGVPNKSEVLSDETRITAQGGVSACCGEAPEYPIVNLATSVVFHNLAYSADAYWKQQTTDLNMCLGGHEEVHRNVLGGIIPPWANEGLAQFFEERFRRLPGTPASPALTSCGANSFRGISYFTATEEDIPYRNVLTDGQMEPRIYWYLTGACFWDHISRTYGDPAIRSILDRAKFLPEPVPADSGTYSEAFVRDAVIPAVGQGIWPFLNSIGIYPSS